MMLLVFFSFFTLFFIGSTAAYINRDNYEIEDIYQMKFTIKNYRSWRTNGNGYFTSAKFPVENVGAKSRFQLAVYPSGNIYPRYFSLAVLSVDNNRDNTVVYNFDLYVLEGNFDQSGRAQRNQHENKERCGSNICYQEEAMFLKSRINEFVKSDGSLDVFVEVFRLQKCAGMCTSTYNSQPHVLATRCVKEGSLNYCVQSEIFPQFRANKRSALIKPSWRIGQDMMPQIRSAKNSCPGLTGKDCAVIKDVASETLAKLTTEFQRSSSSDSTLVERTNELKRQIISYQSNSFKDSCDGVFGGLLILKKLIARGVTSTETHINEVLNTFTDLKSKLGDVDVNQPKDTSCDGLQREVTNFKSDIANGNSNSDKQLTAITSDFTAFKKEFNDREAARPKNPCVELQGEVATHNDQYAVGLKHTDSLLNGLEEEINKFRNGMNANGKKDNTCDAVPEKITKLQELLSTGFTTGNNFNSDLADKLINLIKKESAKLREETVKAKDLAAAAEVARTKARNLATRKIAASEEEIRNLEFDLTKKFNEIDNLNC